ncbi:uncharacterized protein LOC105186915 isoform X2 [Harpegnathos saltator]|uniref:Uncharacterized protein n=1 Tax=Harpegnathos saltator TaxID=610380 RepID=E2BVA6_HARSA|nr:uncharacterized protein LOC105186915 isoform X2 [Harpegnathos saltator]EFN80398.1 hypothetical protein EAI_14747 [Harpegnathos saltator]
MSREIPSQCNGLPTWDLLESPQESYRPRDKSREAPLLLFDKTDFQHFARITYDLPDDIQLKASVNDFRVNDKNCHYDWSNWYGHINTSVSAELYPQAKLAKTNQRQLFRKDMSEESADPFSETIERNIAEYLEKEVCFDDNDEIPVYNDSANHMEVEESHFVEKDIVQEDPVADSPEKDSSEEDATDEEVLEILDRQPKSYEQVKEGLRSLVPKRPTTMRVNSGHYAGFKLLFSLVVSLCVILISFMAREQSYQHSTLFANVTVELKKRVYGQDRAMQAVGDYLRLDEPTLKIIALVGGTGVGKSYTVSIVESNFPKYSVRRYFSPISMTMNNVSFSFLYPKLIVLENLKEHDLPDVVNFLKTREQVDVNQYITVLAVFNVEHMDNDSIRTIDLDRSTEAIRNSFAGENLDVKVIVYEPLSEDVLEKCIADAARDSKVTLSNGDVEFLKKHLAINNAGCKGAYRKVQVIGRK